MADNVRQPRKASAMRLSQHLDLGAQLEVLQLKVKLQEMTDLVRQLLLHMDQLEKIPGFFTKEGTRTDSVATQTSPVEEKSWDRSPASKAKLKELVDMNINWQKYNALQEKHIQELHNKVEEMQQKLTAAENNSQLLTQQLRDENVRLKAEVGKLRNDALQTAVEAKGKTAGNTEREQLLEAQLMVYKEDFKTERRDREAVQARVIQLEMELLEMQRKMQKKKSTGFRYPAPYSTHDGDLQLDGGDHVDSMTAKFATDVVDGPPPSKQVVVPPESDKVRPGRREGLSFDGRLPGPKEDILCCTKCFKVFTKSEHLELLEHIEECDRQ